MTCLPCMLLANPQSDGALDAQQRSAWHAQQERLEQLADSYVYAAFDAYNRARMNYPAGSRERQDAAAVLERIRAARTYGVAHMLKAASDNGWDKMFRLGVNPSRRNPVPEYKVAQHPRTKQWYVVGHVGGGKYMPVSDGKSSRAEAERWLVRQRSADAAQRRELSSWDVKRGHNPTYNDPDTVGCRNAYYDFEHGDRYDPNARGPYESRARNERWRMGYTRCWKLIQQEHGAGAGPRVTSNPRVHGPVTYIWSRCPVCGFSNVPVRESGKLEVHYDPRTGFRNVCPGSHKPAPERNVTRGIAGNPRVHEILLYAPHTISMGAGSTRKHRKFVPHTLGSGTVIGRHCSEREHRAQLRHITHSYPEARVTTRTRWEAACPEAAYNPQQQKSRGHVFFYRGGAGDTMYELYKDASGNYYTAPVGNVIDMDTGNRIGRWEGPPRNAKFIEASFARWRRNPGGVTVASLARMTTEQLNRRWDTLVRRAYKAMAGGTQYGIDMPTLRAVLPDLYAEMAAVRDEARRRGGVRSNPELLIIGNPKRGATSMRGRRHRRGRRCTTAYAKFVKAQWRAHRAQFKRLGFKRVSKRLALAWKKKH